MALVAAGVLFAAYLLISTGLYRYVWIPPCSSHVLWVIQTPDCDPRP